jgi:hypothetical protein
MTAIRYFFVGCVDVVGVPFGLVGGVEFPEEHPQPQITINAKARICRGMVGVPVNIDAI